MKKHRRQKSKTLNKPFSATFLLLMVLSLIIFIPFISAFKIDNNLKYKNNDMIVEITNAFGFGEKYGEATLKSHKTTTEIITVPHGEEVLTMYYEFNFNEIYENGLGKVTFRDLNTGRNVNRNYSFALIAPKSCENVVDKNGTVYEQCTPLSYTKLTNTDIPKGKVTIGLLTDVYEGDYIDGIWTIAGKKISRHAEWTEGTYVSNISTSQLHTYCADSNGTNLFVCTLSGTSIYNITILNNSGSYVGSFITPRISNLVGGTVNSTTFVALDINGSIATYYLNGTYQNSCDSGIRNDGIRGIGMNESIYTLVDLNNDTIHLINKNDCSQLDEMNISSIGTNPIGITYHSGYWWVSENSEGVFKYYPNFTYMSNFTYSGGETPDVRDIGSYGGYLYIPDEILNKIFKYEGKRITINKASWNSQTAEGSTETFTLNITLISGIQVSTIDLIYNSTLYSTSFSLVDGNAISTRSITIPNVATSTDIDFYWNITLSNGDGETSFNYTQTINNLQIGNCTTYTNRIYNFTLRDEEDQSILTNTSIEIQLKLYDSTKEVNVLNFSQEYDDINPATVCINSSLLTSLNYSADLVVKYTANISNSDNSSTEYAKEYYHIFGDVIGNYTVPYNITLYGLKEDDSTEFQLTFRDSSFVLASNVLIYLYRQYVSDSDFKIVEVPLTDSNGQTILHMVRNDAVYNIVAVNENGEILDTFNKVIAFCQDYTIGQCTINLNARAGGDVVYDFDDEYGITYTNPTYSNVTDLVTFVFTSSDLSSKTVSTEVIRNNQFGNRSVCSDSLTSSTGTLSCDVSSVTDTDRFLFVNIYVDGDLMATSTIDLEASDFGFGIVNGAFFSFLIILFIITMFSEDRQILVISLVLGWAFVIGFGLISGKLFGSRTVVSAGIWLVISAMIYLWKLNNEETV